MRQHWHALIAVILTISVGIAIVLLAASELDHGTAGHISTEETTLLATVLGAGIGAIATFLGTREREDSVPMPPSEPHLVYRWPEESQLKRPYDQDLTQEYEAVTPEDEG